MCEPPRPSVVQFDDCGIGEEFVRSLCPSWCNIYEIFAWNKHSLSSNVSLSRNYQEMKCLVLPLRSFLFVVSFLQKVGCDLVLESGSIPDRCGICGGDGSTCEPVSGKSTETYSSSGKSVCDYLL